MHDPFAMRPFFGYNFGHYLDHWLSMENTAGRKLPKIFHVNWFRKSDQVFTFFLNKKTNCNLVNIRENSCGLDLATMSASSTGF